MEETEIDVSKCVLIAKRFYVISRLGGGSFGEVMLGLDSKTNDYVAIKLEKATDDGQSQLFHEARLYRYLRKGGNIPGIPIVYYYGHEGDFNIMAMEFLGPSLERLRVYCGGTMCLKSAVLLGLQCFARLEYMHSMHYIHRDVKPDNFVMGVAENWNQVYVIDLGLAKGYRDWNTLRHIPFIDRKPLTGTVRYASLNVHLGYQQARRDDMEAVLYMMVYFVKGKLPWQGLPKAKNRQLAQETVMKCKAAITADQLCADMPQQFKDLFDNIRNLKFEDTPPYEQYCQMLHSVLKENHLTYDNDYEWLTVTPPANSGHVSEGGSVATGTRAAYRRTSSVFSRISSRGGKRNSGTPKRAWE